MSWRNIKVRKELLSKIFLILIFVSTALTALSAQGQITKKILKVPQDVPTIQEAITQASGGGVIEVDATKGPYRGPFSITKSITLKSVNGKAVLLPGEDNKPVIDVGLPRSDVPLSSSKINDLIRKVPDYEPPPGRLPDENFESGDFSSFPWEPGQFTNNPWSVTSEKSISGNYSAQAGEATGQYLTGESALKVVLNVKAGVVSFLYRANPTPGKIAHLCFSAMRLYKSIKSFWYTKVYSVWSGHVTCGSFDKDSGIQRVSIRIPVAGRWKFKWINDKPGIRNMWIDDIYFPPMLDKPPTHFSVPKPLSNVTIDGFQIEGGSKGIYLHHVNKITLQNNVISNTDIGIKANDIVQSTIENNEIEGCSEVGVEIEYGKDNIIKENRIKPENIGIKEGGFSTKEGGFSQGNQIKGNLIQGEKIISEGHTSSYSDGAGLRIFGKKTLVRGNTVEGCNNGASISGERAVVLNNVFFRNKEAGIKAGRNSVKIEGNLIKENGRGIVFNHSSKSSVIHNKILSNKAEGILSEQSEEIEITDNEIKLNGNSGVVIEEGSKLSLKDNNIQENGKIGVLIQNSRENILQENRLTGHGIGVKVISGSGNQIRDGNLVVNNQLEGILLQDTGKVLVVGNTFRENVVGISLVDTTKSKILANNLDSSRNTAIRLSSSSQNEVNKNTIQGNNIGISLTESVNNTMSTNKIRENFLSGLQLSNSSANTIQSNVIRKNEKTGIILAKSTNNTIMGNQISNNGKTGLMLSNYSQENTLKRNNINTEDIGLQVNDSGANQIVSNTFKKINQAIQLSSSDENELVGNSIEDAKQGIKIEGSSHNIFQNLTITKANWGITLVDSYLNRVQSCALKLNQDGGIFLSGSRDNKLHGNRISDSGYGILLKESLRNEITDNSITKAGIAGISLSQSSWRNTIQGNVVQGSKYALSAKESFNNLFQVNHLKKNELGLILANSSTNTIRWNLIVQNSIGTLLEDVGKSKLIKNQIEKNAIGIQLKKNIVGSVIMKNNIYGNKEFGLQNLSNQTVNATLNWWGNPSGPSGTGPGAGDPVSSLVLYKPWLKRRVKIEKQLPVAHFSYAPGEPETNEVIIFDGSNSADPDGNIVKYEWDFNGDGVVDKQGIKTTHSFASAGHYTIVLLVTDDDGIVNSMTQTVTIKKEPKLVTITVAKDGSGDYRSIQEAINSASKDDIIYVKPGVYEEHIDFKDGIILQGAGKESTKIKFKRCWRSRNVLSCTNVVIDAENINSGKIEGFTVDCSGTGPNESGTICFGVKSSKLTISNNIITGATGSGIKVNGDSDPLIGGNIIRNNQKAGIDIFAGAKGTIQNNKIYGNGLAGIAARKNADPLIQHNVIKDNKAGVVVYEGSDPLIENNSIRANQQSGIFIHTHGKGVIRDNEIYENGHSGISVAEGSDPLIRGNIIRANNGGIVLYNKAKGSIANNQIFGNAYSGIDVENSDPLIKNNTIVFNQLDGIWAYAKAMPVIKNNIIAQNKAYGINILGYSYGVSGNPKVSFNNVWGNYGGNYSGLAKPKTDISYNPQFVNPEASDLRLKPTSPCIGAGEKMKDVGAISYKPSLEVNTPPIARFTFSPTYPGMGETVNFSAQESRDRDGTVESYSWDFNEDGIVDNRGPQVSYAFSTPVIHSIKLIVTDNQGAQNSIKKKILVVKSSIKPDCKLARDLFDEAWKTYDMGSGSGNRDFESAIKLYRKAINLCPDYIAAYYWLGGLYLTVGKYKKAIEKFQEAIELEPRFDSAYLKLGWSYRERGQFEQAIRFLNKAIEINPYYIPAYLDLTSTYNAQGKYKNAFAEVKKAKSLTPEVPGVNRALAMVYFYHGNYEKAVKRLNRIIESNPEYAPAYLSLGWIHFLQGKYESAIKKFEKVVELTKDQSLLATTYNNLGYAYYKLGNFDQAIEQLKKTLSFETQLGPVLTLETNTILGRIYQDKGNLEQAIEHFKTALSVRQEVLKKHPYDRNVYMNLALSFNGLGEEDEAVKYLTKVLDLSKEVAATDVIATQARDLLSTILKK